MGAEFVQLSFIYIINLDYKQIMFRSLLCALLLVATLQEGYSDSYFLSPPLPPSAFVGQYYTTTFRILGLDNPVFKFIGLPPFFKGYPDGTIQGTPNKIGSFAVTVTYSAPGCNGKSDVVIRVAGSVSSVYGTDKSGGVLAVNRFIVVNQSSSLVYKVGNKVNLNLQAANGKAPYTWSFVNLPSGLAGDKIGKITGTIQNEGYYSFNAICNDATGQSADVYYTFNVQPSTLAPSSVLLEVPNRNVPVQYDINQVANQQIAAENAVYAAIKVVNNQKIEVSQRREANAKTTLALQFASSQEKTAVERVAQAAVKRDLAVKAEAKAHEILEAANKIVALATLNVNNAIKAKDIALNNLNIAQAKFGDANRGLQVANSRFINAQAESSQAAQNAKAALTAALNAQNVYNLAFNAYGQAKKILSDAQDQKLQADFVIQAARNALSLATQVNSNAQSDLTIAQDVYKKAYSALDNANNLVSGLTRQLNEAGNHLGVAKFNLVQANNNLFVAQAKKEQADKATAIIRTQAVALPEPGSTSTYIFGGCNQLAYPSVSGTAAISRSNSLGYTLASGHTLLFGDCTKRDPCADGDVIVYSGYLKDGYVHGCEVRKFIN